MHLTDFGIEAEWHFFASCHGKGPCDGLGATVKRGAAKESLERVRQKAISTAHQLYKWAVEKFKDSISFCFVSKGEIEEVRLTYASRFKDAPPLEGIRSCHCIAGLSENIIMMKQYSSASTCQYVYFGAQENPSFDDMWGFVIVVHNNTWRLAYTKKRMTSSRKLQVLLLENAHPPRLFKFSEIENKAVKLANEVLAIVNVDSEGECYKLSRKDHTFALQCVKERFPQQEQRGSKRMRTKSK